MNQFGQTSKGGGGHVYDSKAEKTVSRHLDDLCSEQVIYTYMPHLFIAGLEVDFFVQLGSSSSQKSAPIIIEYDGMGLSRSEGLEGRIRRLSSLATYGVETRWLTRPTIEATRKVCTDYDPPHFIYLKETCPSCGHHQKKYLIDRDDDHTEKQQVQQSTLCKDCK